MSEQGETIRYPEGNFEVREDGIYNLVTGELVEPIIEPAAGETPPAPPAPQNRAERRRQRRDPMKHSHLAWYCTALDGKVHVVQRLFGATEPKRTTVCGRQALALDPEASTKKNRCVSCARVL